jgi:pimeloyl-ACP methyl ester carboxylesterase
MKIVFAHGFEGSPHGSKIKKLVARGHEVIAPDLYARGMTLSHMRREVLDALATHPEAVFIGSSMGGLSGSWALNDEPISRQALLLAPAFDVWRGSWSAKWTPDELERWAHAGSIPYHHRGLGREVRLPFTLIQELQDIGDTFSFSPQVTHTVRVIHGTEDSIVPISGSEAVALRCPQVQLFEVADDHRLHGEETWALIDRLLSQMC